MMSKIFKYLEDVLVLFVKMFCQALEVIENLLKNIKHINAVE